MFDKVLLAVLLSASLFVGYLVFTKQLKIEAFDIRPAPGPPVLSFPPADVNREITSGGPNTPGQAPPPESVVERLPGPQESDPYDDTYGSSAMKDNLRYPERFYGPAPQATNTQIALESGLAGIESGNSASAIQTFSPEMAQNGGQFIEGGIFANDTSENVTYSAL